MIPGGVTASLKRPCRGMFAIPPRRDVCRLRCGAMVTKVLTTIVWVSVLVLGLLFVVFATPLIFLIDND
jgi:hypothetical protein